MHAKKTETSEYLRAVKQVITYLQSGALLLLLVSACSPSPSPEIPRTVAVRVASVRTGPMRETIDYVGTVHSTNEIKVLARVQGKLTELPFAEGSLVEHGDVLATIAAPEMNARLSRMRADVARAREESAFLCRQAETEKNLHEADVVSRVQADSARQKCESATAALRAARAGMREQAAMAGYTVETAPFDGKVLQWLARPEENLMPGRPILLLGNGTLEVRVQVHEKDVAAGIVQGTAALLSTGVERPLPATVEYAAPMAAGPGRMFEVRIPIEDDSAAGLRHGMSIDVGLVLKETVEALSVPETALRETSSGYGVYKIEDRRSRWIAVTPKIRAHGWVAVESDLAVGDHVVVGNLGALRDDSSVYPVSADKDI